MTLQYVTISPPINPGFTALAVSCGPDGRHSRFRHNRCCQMERAHDMTSRIGPLTKPLTALGLLAALAACGNDVHSIGVSMGCGLNSSPYLGGQSEIPVRCGPQSQSPYGPAQ